VPAVSPQHSTIDGGFGWWVVAGAFSANLVTFGILFSFGVFLTPIAETFGTTTGPVASIFSGSVCVYYLAGVAGGRLGDRYGARPVVAVGAITLGLGLAAASVSSALWMVWVMYVPLVGVGVGACYSPMLGAVSRWFDRRRSLALSLVLAGVASGTLLGPMLLRLAIDDIGWRVTFRWLALLAVTVLGLAALLCRPAPGEADRPAPLSIRDISRSRELRRLYLSIIVISPGFYAPLVFFNDYAINRGIGAGRAAALVGISGAFSIVVRLIAGSFGDRFDALGRYRFSYGLMTGALLVWLLSGGSYLGLVASALFHGAGWAVWVTATPTVLAGWFGVSQLGGLLGLLYTGLGIGALAGPAVSGFIIDSAGYRPAIAATLVTSIGATVITLLPLGPTADSSTIATALEQP
jgi:MFS family permease